MLLCLLILLPALTINEYLDIKAENKLSFKQEQ